MLLSRPNHPPRLHARHADICKYSLNFIVRDSSSLPHLIEFSHVISSLIKNDCVCVHQIIPALMTIAHQRFQLRSHLLNSDSNGILGYLMRFPEMDDLTPIFRIVRDVQK